MRLTVRTNLAMRTLMFCAVNKGRVVRKHEIAEVCNASENHLAQVIHKLAQAGLITTVRGRSGGLVLQRDPAELRVGEVVRTFEGDVPLTECMEADNGNCPLSEYCSLKCAFSDALNAFYASLNRLTVADLVANNTDLTRLLSVA
ncbi:Rrf2 family transcriptional regulator [Pseudorhodobacter sp. W20_MBD10_FR17]|uniref:RrF2 family transcriptional regulator n=1 Tax=Pseudorhodobacter sp. W20_MBD10_FR17 TaxID=3240266 RepID=UPI003F9E3BA6